MRLWTAGMVVLAIALLAGCGGGGGPDVGETSAQAGTIGGTVELAGSPADSYDILLDGATCEASLDAEGTFLLTGLPAGEHVIDVVSQDGLESGRSTVVVEPGQITQIPDPISISGAGQICGMVVKRENGVITPLAGVRVVARSDLIWILTDNGASLRTADAPDDTALIYPPPPGVTYVAFTKEDGSYRMRGVRPGPYFVVVAVAGLTTGQAYVIVRPYQTAVADFVLVPVVEPVGTVTGTVYGESSAVDRIPLVAAHVAIICDNNWQPPPPIDDVSIIGSSAGDVPPDLDNIVPPHIVWQVFRTLTDRHGHYRLTVPSGPAGMVVWKRYYELQKRRIKVPVYETIIQDFFLRMVDEIPPPTPPPAD